MSIHTSSSIICSCAFPSLRCSQRSNLREKTEELRTSERPQRSAAALRLDLHFSTIMDLHYSAIIHNARTGDAVYVVDPDYTIVHWDSRMESLTGALSEEALGKRCYEAVMGEGEGGEPFCA